MSATAMAWAARAARRTAIAAPSATCAASACASAYAAALPSALQRSTVRHHSNTAGAYASAPSPSAGGSSSVDPAEVSKFGRMAAQWWDRQGQVRPLHLMNPVRVDYIRQQVAKHWPQRKEMEGREMKGLDVLDVGCGGGLLSESLARLGGRVHGIDAAAASVQIAQLHAAQDPSLAGQLRYSCATAESLLGSGQQFDVVCALEVVEHVTHAPSFLQTMAALVKPGGIMFVSTMNQTNKSWMMAIVGAEYVLQWVPVGTHDWHKFLSPTTLTSLIDNAYRPERAPFFASSQRPQPHTPALPLMPTEAETTAARGAADSSAPCGGMRVIDACGMTFDPLRSRWQLDASDLDCNYIVTAVKANDSA